MILTDLELNRLRETLESQANFDEELVRRCGNLLHLGAYDEAVRSAFILLEERLREMMGEEGMTGTNLANAAFNTKDGPLAKHLGKNISEREGLRELYSGAFKVFRNPSAHSAVGYNSSDGKEIVVLVNLLLRILKRAEELPAPGFFPENLENALLSAEKTIGSSAASRLRVFLGNCMKAGVQPPASSKQWIPFQKHARFKAPDWTEHKPHKIAVFYIVNAGSTLAIRFPIDYYYSKVYQFNTDVLVERLTGLGFYATGKNGELQADLKTLNNEKFFQNLLELVSDVADELEDSLHHAESAH
jgi:uncharacterized protein (TIGR02391 family)